MPCSRIEQTSSIKAKSRDCAGQSGLIINTSICSGCNGNVFVRATKLFIIEKNLVAKGNKVALHVLKKQFYL